MNKKEQGVKVRYSEEELKEKRKEKMEQLLGNMLGYRKIQEEKESDVMKM